MKKNRCLWLFLLLIITFFSNIRFIEASSVVLCHYDIKNDTTKYYKELEILYSPNTSYGEAWGIRYRYEKHSLPQDKPWVDVNFRTYYNTFRNGNNGSLHDTLVFPEDLKVYDNKGKKFYPPEVFTCPKNATVETVANDDFCFWNNEEEYNVCKDKAGNMEFDVSTLNEEKSIDYNTISEGKEGIKLGDLYTPVPSLDMTFCEDSAPIWQYVGYILLALKTIIPLVIIILGIFDLANAVVSKDDQAVSKASKSIAKRLIMGIAIFFVPTIISYVFSLVSDASPFIAKMEGCQLCLLRPTSSACKLYKQEHSLEKIKNNTPTPKPKPSKQKENPCPDGYYCPKGGPIFDEIQDKYVCPSGCVPKDPQSLEEVEPPVEDIPPINNLCPAGCFCKHPVRINGKLTCLDECTCLK